MENVTMVDLVGLCALTTLFHFSTKWFNARNEAKALKLRPPSAAMYVLENPAYITMTVLGTASAFWAYNLIGWMNPGSALAIGWMGASMAKNAAEKFAGERLS